MPTMQENYLPLPPSGDSAGSRNPEDVFFVDGLLKKTQQKRHKIPALAEVLEAIFEEYGGARMFAARYHQVSEDPKTSQMTRAKMLETPIKLLMTYASLMGESNEDLGMLNEEDLRAAALSVLKTLNVEEERPA